MILLTVGLTCTLITGITVGCQGSQGTPAALGAACTLTVENVEQFEPMVWRMMFATQPQSRAEIFIAGRPFVELQLWTDAGHWAGKRPEPDGRSLNTEAGGGWPKDGELAVIDHNRSLAMRGELTRWQCLAWPGRYRARVVWTEDLGRGTSLTGRKTVARTSNWVEFTVAAPVNRASPLASAMVSGGPLWDAYVRFMERPMRLTALSGPTGDDLVRFTEGLATAAHEEDCVDTLDSRIGELPPTVRERVIIAKAIKHLQLGRSAPDVAARTGQLDSAFVKAETVSMRSGGYYGDVANVVKWSVMEARGGGSVAAAVREGIAANRGVREIFELEPSVRRLLWPETGRASLSPGR